MPVLGEHVRVWRPAVPGVGEVLHAHFTEHAYPAHTHEHWTVLLVDTGGVAYALDRQRHDAAPRSVSVLPPHVPHDGRAAQASGFDKRVVYLDRRWLPERLVGAAVRRPGLRDDALLESVARLHQALQTPGEELEAESRLALVCERIVQHLDHAVPAPDGRRRSDLAQSVRRWLDVDQGDGATLESLATTLGAHPSQLVRAFSREYGLPPHRYLTGRRVDRARRLLLDGMRPADVAQAVGFYDQAHLGRHFRRVLGTTPGAFALGTAS